MKIRPLALFSVLAAPVQMPATAPFNAVFAPITTPAQPTMYFTGGALVSTCAEAEKALDGMPYETTAAIECTSYLTGALDQQTRIETSRGMSPTICVPLSVTKGQLAVVFLNYARAKPEDQNAIATDLVAAALTDAYPCPSKLTGP